MKKKVKDQEIEDTKPKWMTKQIEIAKKRKEAKTKQKSRRRSQKGLNNFRDRCYKRLEAVL